MLIFVPLSHIDDNIYQSRTEYGDIEELAGRIAAARDSYPQTFGLMQVPRGRVTIVDAGTIVPVDDVRMFAGENGRWNEDPKTFRIQLAFGHRRLRAFLHLHETKTPGYEDGRFPVHIDALTDKQMLDAVWAENYERKDISAVEQAELIKLKLEQLGENATHAAIGEEWGLSRPVITNRLRLLELPAAVQQANREGKLSERLALALKPVLRIGELTQGSGVQWGSKVGEQWGSPASPEKYVEYVLDRADTVTSDQVREFAKRLTKHAGEELPGWLAKEKFDGRDIEQPQCKGCQYRVDQSCLRPSCMKAKLKAWPDIALEAFSQESGIPTSDREADFKLFGNDPNARARLKALYDAGETGGGMVCGWYVNDSAARPYGEKSGSYVWNITNEKDGRCGIALGYRGNLPAADLAPGETGEPVYEMPEAGLIASWNVEAPKIQKAAYKTMTGALADKLLNEVADFDVLQALIFAPNTEWIDDVDKLAKKLVEFLIDRGRGIDYAYAAYDFVQMYQSVIRRAGLKIDVLGDASEAAAKTAVTILESWYGNHIGYGWERYAKKAAQQIAQWERLSGAAASPMAEHIARAKRHIEAKIAAEGEAARQAEKADRILQEADEEWEEFVSEEDTAVCAHCQDILEPADATTCSCGAVLCEDCYVEENHVFHDKNRDSVFDDLVASFPELVEEETETAVTDPWVCEVCAQEFENEADLLAHQFNSPCEKELRETAVTDELTMTEVATEWLRTYQGNDGRTWSDLTPGQTHHANSPCYQAFVAAFPVEKEPKLLLKQARAQLEREAATAVYVSQES